FNNKVSAYLTPTSSSLLASDETLAQHFIDFANYQFDLCELYARKLRKTLFEMKKMSSSIQFIQNHFDSMMMAYHNELTLAMQQTHMGENKEVLKMIHEKVQEEILALEEFCKE